MCTNGESFKNNLGLFGVLENIKMVWGQIESGSDKPVISSALLRFTEKRHNKLKMERYEEIWCAVSQMST